MRIYVLVALLLYDLFARLQGPAKTVHADLVRHRIQITLPRNIYKGSTFVRHAGAGANNNPATRTETMEVERRLVYRVLRHWTEIARGGRLPRRDEINPYIRDEDAANCLLIAVRSPIERSHFVMVRVSLAVALCPTNTLAGMLLSRLSRVVLARCGLTFEGVATLSGVDILHRSALLPLSEDGVTIDHVLGAVSYHPLPAEEALTPQVLGSWFPSVVLDGAVARQRQARQSRTVVRGGMTPI